MWGVFTSWLIKSKGAKIGAGAASGSGLLALIFGLHSDVSSKIEKQETRLKEHVQLSLVPIKVENTNLKEDVKETKQMVREIRNHLLNKE